MLSRGLPIAIALRSALALVALGSTPGCSYLLVDGPPAGHEQMRYFDCTSSRAAPIADAIIAGVYGVSGTAMASEVRDTDGGATVLVASLAIAAVEAASAVHGFRKTSECADAKRGLTARVVATAGKSTSCGSDRDCKGDRICEVGLCVAPH
jgi:hypothetical protein